MKADESKVRMFVNGQAMSGGSLNGFLRSATFLGEVRTGSNYRFYSVRDEFPGLVAVQEAGEKIPGELYELSYAQLREELLPNEPEELELTIIELEDGSGSLSMGLRQSAISLSDVVDITGQGGWLAYRDSKKSKA